MAHSIQSRYGPGPGQYETARIPPLNCKYKKKVEFSVPKAIRKVGHSNRIDKNLHIGTAHLRFNNSFMNISTNSPYAHQSKLGAEAF